MKCVNKMLLGWVMSCLVVGVFAWGSLPVLVGPAFAQSPTLEPDQNKSASEAAVAATTPQPAGADPYPYTTGIVTKVVQEQRLPSEDQTFYTQRLQVKRHDTGETLELEVGSQFQPLNEQQRLKKGARVVLTEQQTSTGETEVVIADVYRLPVLAWLLAGFLVLVLIVAKWQGLMSLLGMVSSLLVLTSFIVPEILQGQNPMVISIVGAGLIAALTVYLSHGWNLSSHLALGSMLVTLGLVVMLSSAAVQLAQLVGLGSEEAYFLQFGGTANVNLQGLLLGGIVLGALGILDDICIAQISVVFQLKEVNAKMGFEELYQRGLRIGKDHVASLVNTLVLAYAGANLPLFLLFTMNKTIPLWVTLNNEIIAEEVVRTLVGSIGLVLAVPIATLCAAYAAGKLTNLKTQPHRHSHAH